jgi:thiol-disulfide isomerase/thioredoxin
MRSALLRLALAAALLATFGGPALAASLRVGAPAPALGFRTLDGQEVDLSTLKGKVVLVNIWATWCAPCRAEMPMLDAYYRSHRDQGFVLLGLSADRTRDKDEVRRVMSAFSYPTGMLADAKPNAIGEPRSLPMSFILDKAGIVRAVFGADGVTLTGQKLDAVVSPLMR